MLMTKEKSHVNQSAKNGERERDSEEEMDNRLIETPKESYSHNPSIPYASKDNRTRLPPYTLFFFHFALLNPIL